MKTYSELTPDEKSDYLYDMEGKLWGKVFAGRAEFLGGLVTAFVNAFHDLLEASLGELKIPRSFPTVPIRF